MKRRSKYLRFGVTLWGSAALEYAAVAILMCWTDQVCCTHLGEVTREASLIHPGRSTRRHKSWVTLVSAGIVYVATTVRYTRRFNASSTVFVHVLRSIIISPEQTAVLHLTKTLFYVRIQSMFRLFFEPAPQTNRDSDRVKTLVRYNYPRYINM